MKNFVLTFSLLLLAVCANFAQDPANLTYYQIKSAGTDTIVNQDTVIWDLLELDFNRYEWNYSLTIKADSVSGANGATAYLEVSNTQAGLTPVWERLTTNAITIDGPGTQVTSMSGVLYWRRFRVVIISPSGTRRTAVRLDGSVKRV